MFLNDGGQPAESIAAILAGYLDGARRTLDIALYDLRLDDACAEILSRSVDAAKQRGVRIRMVFNQDHPKKTVDPPPNQVDWDLLHRLDVGAIPIPGVPDLMHHKYVVKDGSEVWTGSANWTTDSWTREENVIVRVLSPELAGAYTANFEELWTKRQVVESGFGEPAWFQLADGSRVRPYFTPGRAKKLVHELSQRLATARRLRICSPVITCGPVLGTLAEILEKGDVDLAGCYDATQMDEVLYQWGQQPETNWKIAAWKTVAAAVPWGAKRSTPYSSGSVHDFMHAKILVADDYVYTGSFNLSHSGEQNAENFVEFEDPALAEMFVTYIDQVAARYRPK